MAEWKEKEAALVFGSGYAAALGTIPALVGKGCAAQQFIETPCSSDNSFRIIKLGNVSIIAALEHRAAPSPFCKGWAWSKK